MVDDAIRFEWIDGPEMPNALRPATNEEWNKIDDILLAQGWMSLNRVLTRVRVGWEGDEIVAISTIQMLPNVGPMWVAKHLRGTGVADDLVGDTLKFLLESKCRGWIVIADSPHTAKIAVNQGMEKIKSAVYITPTTPATSSEKVH
jgi:hypothetical protein